MPWKSFEISPGDFQWLFFKIQWHKKVKTKQNKNFFLFLIQKTKGWWSGDVWNHKSRYQQLTIRDSCLSFHKTWENQLMHVFLHVPEGQGMLYKVSVEKESVSIGLAWFHGQWKFKFSTRDISVWRTIGRVCLVKARFLVLLVLSQVCRIRKTKESHSFFGCYGLSMTLRVPIRYCFLMIQSPFNRHSW